MAEKLRIETTPEERERLYVDHAVEFSVARGGTVIIYADWGDADELYGDGCSIHIPSRIWAEALPWIAEQLAALPAPAPTPPE